mmetsp:Transcript_24824/g.62447  ORF Transcript_24824/g.62447 Transcript_24824/m.62447 type:complete len:436 (-) Transcript_24824:855-2162(-)
MERWAGATPKYANKRVNFVCVCLVDRGLATEMAAEARLQHAVNGFVESKAEMPRYGQLGCQGFVVFAPGFRMFAPETSSFLQIKGLAFANVEALLDSMLNQVQRVRAGPQDLPPAMINFIPPFLCPGEMVQIRGLANRKELNGRQAVCLQDGGDGTYVVTTGGQMQLRIKAENLLNTTRDTRNVLENGATGGQYGEVPSCFPAAKNNISSGEEENKKVNGGATEAPPTSAGQKLNQSAFPHADASAQAAEEGWQRVKNFLNTHELRSLNIPDMDEQHAECLAALKELVKKRSCDALRTVAAVVEEHFEEEEQMWEMYKFGTENAMFSATKSHKEEHRRVLGEIEHFLDEAGRTGNVVGQKEKVPAAFAEALVKEFFSHIEDYDSKYEKAIRKAMLEGESGGGAERERSGEEEFVCEDAPMDGSAAALPRISSEDK